MPFTKSADHLSTWAPDSWRKRTAFQQPNYPDAEQVEEDEGVLGRRRRVHVAERGGEAEDLELGAGEGRDDGEGVVCFCFCVCACMEWRKRSEEEKGKRLSKRARSERARA